MRTKNEHELPRFVVGIIIGVIIAIAGTVLADAITLPGSPQNTLLVFISAVVAVVAGLAWLPG